MAIWLTADEHYNHQNIINYCNRPFPDMKTMNAEIMGRFIRLVQPEDITYHVGDFALYGGTFDRMNAGGDDIDAIIESLPGRHVFIMGNHDRGNEAKFKIKEIIIEAFGYRFRLLHHPAEAPSDGMLNLTGHVHGLWTWGFNDVGARCFNVGVDVHNFEPIQLATIVKMMRKTCVIKNNT